MSPNIQTQSFGVYFARRDTESAITLRDANFASTLDVTTALTISKSVFRVSTTSESTKESADCAKITTANYAVKITENVRNVMMVSEKTQNKISTKT